MKASWSQLGIRADSSAVNITRNSSTVNEGNSLRLSRSGPTRISKSGSRRFLARLEPFDSLEKILA
jgi:hypothetical protein